MGAVPVALAANVAVCPAVTVWLDGCDVMEGATAAAFTVSVAALLVILPAALVTTRLSLGSTTGVMLALVRKLRMLFWAAVGLAFMRVRTREHCERTHAVVAERAMQNAQGIAEIHLV